MTSAPSDSPPTDPSPPDNRCVKIHDWPDTTDGTKIIRYMKLSTFLLLLNNQLFVPSIHPVACDLEQASRYNDFANEATVVRLHLTRMIRSDRLGPQGRENVKEKEI